MMNILLIEDDREEALLVNLQFKKYEQEVNNIELAVCWCHDRHSLLDAVTKYRWDCFVCDYTLPDMPWPDAFDICKREAPSVPFVVISNKIKDAEGIKAIQYGAADYIDLKWLPRLGNVVVREVLRSEAFRKNDEAHRAVWSANDSGTLGG